jgi:hypothetical protein
MIVTAHIKFSLHTTFLDRMIQIEDNRLPGESIEDGVIRVHKALEAAADRIIKEHESMRGVQEGMPFVKTPIENFIFPPQDIPPRFEINRQHERLEIEIDNCMCEDELKQWKEKNIVLPIPVNDHYKSRLKELTNGTKD